MGKAARGLLVVALLILVGMPGSSVAQVTGCAANPPGLPDDQQIYEEAQRPFPVTSDLGDLGTYEVTEIPVAGGGAYRMTLFVGDLANGTPIQTQILVYIGDVTPGETPYMNIDLYFASYTPPGTYYNGTIDIGGGLLVGEDHITLATAQGVAGSAVPNAADMCLYVDYVSDPTSTPTATPTGTPLGAIDSCATIYGLWRDDLGWYEASWSYPLSGHYYFRVVPPNDPPDYYALTVERQNLSTDAYAVLPLSWYSTVSLTESTLRRLIITHDGAFALVICSTQAVPTVTGTPTPTGTAGTALPTLFPTANITGTPQVQVCSVYNAVPSSGRMLAEWAASEGSWWIQVIAPSGTFPLGLHFWQRNGVTWSYWPQMPTYGLPSPGWYNIVVPQPSPVPNELRAVFVWDGSAPFTVRVCNIRDDQVTPTVSTTMTAVLTAATPAITFTPTRTPTATPTRTPTRTPTASPTAGPTQTMAPTSTVSPDCITAPSNPLCQIIWQQQTQIALAQTQAVPQPSPPGPGGMPEVSTMPIVPTPADFSGQVQATAIATLCDREPCHSATVLTGFMLDVVEELTGALPSSGYQLQAGGGGGSGFGVACEGLPLPFWQPGPFALDPDAFEAATCWLVDVSTPVRGYTRAASVLFSLFVAWFYFRGTMRRIGDV